MPTVELSKGQNAALPSGTSRVTVSVIPAGGAAGLDLDVSALLVGADDRVLSDDHFVFYNQPSCPEGAVTFVGAGTSQVIKVDLAAVPAKGQRVVVAASLTDSAGTAIPFSRARGTRLHVANEANGDTVFSFLPDGLTSETALVLGELYRRGPDWKFRAIGQGYDTGLAGIATDFGVDLEEPQPTHQPAAAVPPPKPAESRPDPEPVRPSTPTLWQAARLWNDAQDANERVLDLFHAALTAATAALGAAEPSISGAFLEADRAREAATTALQRVYGVSPSALHNATGSFDLTQWTVAAEELAEDITETRVPLTRSRRDAVKNGFVGRAAQLLKFLPGAELRTLIEHHGDAIRASDAGFRKALYERCVAVQAAVSALPRLPAIVGSLDLASLIAQPPAAGAGPLVVQVGTVTPGAATVVGRSPGSGLIVTEVEASRSVSIAQPWSVPVLLDMNLRAGIVTTDLRVVNNTLLKLMALLPAGQFKMTLFDPVKLGDSAKFVFGLGDAAETIIGDKVRSTDRELADILVGLEEHLTFVTQKYLQGQYETLGDYNEAAGEVAEPYRALVLYDYPNGFVRPGGSVDDELVARLRKIIGSGQRCGVMTFVVRSEPAFGADDPASKLLPLFPTVEMAHWLARHITAGRGGDKQPVHLKMLVPGYATLALEQAARRKGNDVVLFSREVQAAWRYVPDPEPAPEVVAELLAGVERGLVQASDVRVSLAQVADLAVTKHRRDVARGTRAAETLPRPADTSTWWHGNAADGIAGAFGRVGATDLGVLELDSQIASGALVGGRMGSGKSVLLHAIILSLVTRYSPSELSLYLVDFKEGVEFKAYASEGLPHAKVVAVESHREFGLSVLQSLDAEITRRGALFRASDGQELNLAQYRARTGGPLPRIVLLIDEFHVLFNQDDKIASASADLLDRIVKQGRAFGVHAVLASQTLSGTSALNKATLGLIPIRLALQSSEADSRLLLADDNPDARLLTRPGEGLLNTKGGLKDGNSRFQAAYTAPDERARILQQLRRLADQRGHAARPVVFEGKEAAHVDEAPPGSFGSPFSRGSINVPIGLPLTLDPPVAARLRREPGGNLLLVLADDSAYGLLTVAAASVLRSGAGVEVLDYGPLDAPWAPNLASLTSAGLTVQRRQTASAALERMSALVRERHDLNDLTSRPILLIVAALHRAREFDTGNADGPEPDHLAHILREGPDVGVHVIAWCDKPVSLNRRLTSSMQREFSLRLLGPMSKDDSFALIDSDAASTLNNSQVVLDDHDLVTTVRARRFALPDPRQLQTLVSR